MTGPVKAPPAGGGDDMAKSDELLRFVRERLDQDKAEDIVSIDLRGKTTIADHMVIASGRSTRQVSALTEKLAEELKTRFGLIARIEGKNAGDWVLMDAGDVIVHLFRPEVREFYQLEKMWMTPAESGAGIERTVGSA